MEGISLPTLHSSYTPPQEHNSGYALDYTIIYTCVEQVNSTRDYGMVCILHDYCDQCSWIYESVIRDYLTPDIVLLRDGWWKQPQVRE